MRCSINFNIPNKNDFQSDEKGKRLPYFLEYIASTLLKYFDFAGLY